MDKIVKYALINSVLTALYIILIVFFITSIGNSGLADKPDTIMAPITMLMLFVFSAAFTSSLVFGRPILWYLDGKKKEAVKLLLYTLIVFFLVLLIAFVLLLAFGL